MNITYISGLSFFPISLPFNPAFLNISLMTGIIFNVKKNPATDKSTFKTSGRIESWNVTLAAILNDCGLHHRMRVLELGKEYKVSTAVSTTGVFTTNWRVILLFTHLQNVII